MRIQTYLSTVLALVLPVTASAAPITLTFDSVAVNVGECTDGSSYFASFGITFSPVTPGTFAAICNVQGSGVIPTSGSNVFFGLPDVTNTDLAYDLLFSTPQSQVSFHRAAVPDFTALPPWQAFAYDASDTLVDATPFQPVMFPGPPEALFVLNGPAIVRLRVNAYNSAHVTYNHPPFDDLTIDAVPEPSSIALLACGVGFILRRSRPR